MSGPHEKNKLANKRKMMLEAQLNSRGISDAAVLRAMNEVPREEFVPRELKHFAYYDGPLSIGAGQTISQPYIVALMTECLRLNKDCDVLEIGTGCGYQTAILAKLCREVFTIERIESLGNEAKQRLESLGFSNIKFYIGDGSCGWYEKRKFDRILLTAAAEDMPEPLLEQLAEGGIAVGPFGGFAFQQLVAIEKTRGKIIRTPICGCRFVRLIGEYGYSQ